MNIIIFLITLIIYNISSVVSDIPSSNLNCTESDIEAVLIDCSNSSKIIILINIKAKIKYLTNRDCLFSSTPESLIDCDSECLLSVNTETDESLKKDYFLELNNWNLECKSKSSQNNTDKFNEKKILENDIVYYQLKQPTEEQSRKCLYFDFELNSKFCSIYDTNPILKHKNCFMDDSSINIYVDYLNTSMNKFTQHCKNSCNDGSFLTHMGCSFCPNQK